LAYTELAYIEQLDGTGGGELETSGVTTTRRLQTANEINSKSDRKQQNNSTPDLKTSKGAERGSVGGGILEGHEGMDPRSMKGILADATTQPFTSVTTPSSTCLHA
jgi:hypothetical protein